MNFSTTFSVPLLVFAAATAITTTAAAMMHAHSANDIRSYLTLTSANVLPEVLFYEGHRLSEDSSDADHGLPKGNTDTGITDGKSDFHGSGAPEPAGIVGTRTLFDKPPCTCPDNQIPGNEVRGNKIACVCRPKANLAPKKQTKN